MEIIESMNKVLVAVILTGVAMITWGLITAFVCVLMSKPNKESNGHA